MNVSTTKLTSDDGDGDGSGGGVARERDRGGHQESGAGQDHRANGAANARDVGVLADPAHQRNDEERGSDQRDQAGEGAGESGGEVTDAHQVQAVGPGAGAARDDRGVELAIGQDVARDYEILADDGQRRHAAEGRDHGFEQQQVQQEAGSCGFLPQQAHNHGDADHGQRAESELPHGGERAERDHQSPESVGARF